jgi:hypothetical protein
LVSVMATTLTGCDDTTMEGLEAARVSVENGSVPADFGPGSEEYADFEAYGQWPLTFGDCTVYVESGTTAPDFDPVGAAGRPLQAVACKISVAEDGANDAEGEDEEDDEGLRVAAEGDGHEGVHGAEDDEE